MNKYYRKLKRLKAYNYSKSGYYFVTICVDKRKLIFNKEEIKICASKWWQNISEKYLNIRLNEWVIMPNHIHGIIEIKNVGTIHELSLHNRRNMLLPKAIGYFKMNSAKEINRKLNRSGEPFWQNNYYEHIIRNERSLNNIRQYIISNPMKWNNDIENPKRSLSNCELKNHYKNLLKI